jgi:hypothetical protein
MVEPRLRLKRGFLKKVENGQNPHATEEEAVNVPAISVWCGLSFTGMVGLFFFEATVNGVSCVTVLQGTMSCIYNLFCNEDHYF